MAMDETKTQLGRLRKKKQALLADKKKEK